MIYIIELEGHVPLAIVCDLEVTDDHYELTAIANEYQPTVDLWQSSVDRSDEAQAKVWAEINEIIEKERAEALESRAVLNEDAA